MPIRRSDIGTVSTSAIPFTYNDSGPVLVDSARYFTTTPEAAWQYMQDLSAIAQGRAPRFSPETRGLTAEHAAGLLANATAATEAQLLVTGSDGARAMLASMVDFVETGGSLDGIEAPFFSAGVSLVDDPESEELLDSAASAFLQAGGLEEVFQVGEHLVAGRLRADDILPILDAAGGRLGLPSVTDVVHGIEGVADVFAHPGSIELDPGAALEALSGVVKAPGHRLFSSVSQTLNLISPAVAEAFCDFRHSDVGEFVETVGSIALGIGILIGAPAAATIKAGVHIVEGAVAFFTGVWDAIFGDDDDEERSRHGGRRSGSRGDRDRGRSAHPISDEERKKLKSGEHTMVGCAVEDPLVVPDRAPVRRVSDGSCPEPDLTLSVTVPAPGTEGAWPSSPEPKVSGPGVLAVFGKLNAEGPLSFDVDLAAGFGLDQVAETLGWDEGAARELVLTLETLGRSVPLDLARFARSEAANLGGSLPPEAPVSPPTACLPGADGTDALAVALDESGDSMVIRFTPMRQAKVTKTESTARATEIILADVSLDPVRASEVTLTRAYPATGSEVADPRADFAHSRRGTITEYAYASGWKGDTPNPLRLSRVQSVPELIAEITLQVRAVAAGRPPWFG